MAVNWNIEMSKKLYGTSVWSNDYFDINKKGNIEIAPFGKQGHKVDLYEIVKDLTQRQIRFPVLVRFPDIIRSQIQSINSCFQKAIKDHDYKGKYQECSLLK